MKIKIKQFCGWLLIFSSLLILSSCSLPGVSGSTNQGTIRIASQSSTESQIVANIIAELIHHELGYQTTLISNLGSSTVAHQALLRGDADISATRYTGTDLTGTLQMDNVKDPQKATRIVTHEFQKRYHQTWFPSYGFADTYAFMTTQKFARQNQLENVSDLKKVADQLNAGVDSSWMNRQGDGYRDFEKYYGFAFKHVSPMQIGLVYDAVEAGKMQVVLGYSTDGRIKSYNLKLLKDDRHFFPPYNCSMVVNDSLLKKYPKLGPLLHRLDGKINLQTMQALNYQADNDLLEPAVVAHNFLVKHHYFRGGDQ